MKEFKNTCCSLLLIVSFVVLPANSAAVQATPQPTGDGPGDGVVVRTADGVTTATVTYPEGKIVAIFPDDISAGDTISGFVRAIPTGNTEAEKYEHKTSLEQTDVIFGETVNLPVDGPFSAQIAAANAARSIIAFQKKLIRGAEPPRKAVIPVAPRSPSAPSEFVIPPTGQTGHNILLMGPFDGRSGNTLCSVGSQQVAMIAESPRKAVVVSPTNIVGPTEISVSENGRTTHGPFRNIKVQLSAPATVLNQGQKTDVVFTGSGLQDLKAPVPVKMECEGSVTMSGGNSQGFQIKPGDVKKDGTFQKKFTVTGVETGPWSVTGTIQAHPGDRPCYLAGQIVHVENNWGGKKGDWVIGIKEQDGTKGYIHFGGDKSPPLKYCNWIRIGGCHIDENGLIWVDDYEMTTDPTRPPTKPQTPTPTPTPTPEILVPPPTPVPTPTPCKDGDRRDSTVDTKTFDVMDGDSTITFQVYTDKDGAAAAAKGMSDFWKGAKKVGDKITDRLPEGSTIAGWVLAYLDRGSEILDAILNSPLRDAGVSKVTVDLIVTVKRITATCTTTEVCVNGVWVKTKKYEEKVEKTFVRPYKAITTGDSEWENISNSSGRLDRKKLGEFAQKWLHDQLEELKKSTDAYNEFKAKCK